MYLLYAKNGSGYYDSYLKRRIPFANCSPPRAQVFMASALYLAAATNREASIGRAVRAE